MNSQHHTNSNQNELDDLFYSLDSGHAIHISDYFIAAFFSHLNNNDEQGAQNYLHTHQKFFSWIKGEAVDFHHTADPDESLPTVRDIYVYWILKLLLEKQFVSLLLSFWEKHQTIKTMIHTYQEKDLIKYQTLLDLFTQLKLAHPNHASCQQMGDDFYSIKLSTPSVHNKHSKITSNEYDAQKSPEHDEEIHSRFTGIPILTDIQNSTIEEQVTTITDQVQRLSLDSTQISALDDATSHNNDPAPLNNDKHYSTKNHAMLFAQDETPLKTNNDIPRSFIPG